MINRKLMEKSEFSPLSAIIGQDEAGKRLDAALERHCPGLGLRARRRLWEWCRITLDGREAAPGAIVRAGQKLEVLPLRTAGPGTDLPWGEIRPLEATPAFCAIYKPGGIASARLDGGGRYSAEEYVLDNWPALGLPAAPPAAPMLCNRLDAATSGLLLWAFGMKNYESFRAMEARGEALKHYLALVRGQTPDELYLDAALGTDGGGKTRVFARAEPDAVRHTRARRLAVIECAGHAASLLEVQIRRGARHQIRAHLGAAGFPIIGDKLYGGEAAPVMYLHHRRIEFPAFAAEAPAPWPVTMPGDAPR